MKDATKEKQQLYKIFGKSKNTLVDQEVQKNKWKYDEAKHIAKKAV